MAAVFHYVIQDKFCRAAYNFSYGIAVFLQSAVQIVFIDLIGQPDAAHRGIHVFTVALDGCSLAPKIHVVVAGKAAAAIIDARRLLSAPGHLVHHADVRLQALLKAADTCTPIVHLRIDIDSVVTAPRRADIAVPLPLQIQRLPPLPAAGDHQVLAIVIEQFTERVKIARVFEHLIRGDGR